MFRRQLLIAALLAGMSSGALAYDIGKLSCANVGQLAAHMLTARQSGVPAEVYLSALNDKLPADATVERNLALNLAKVVYSSDELAAMQPEQAYVVFAQNCLQGQEQDRMSGQQDEDGAAIDEDEDDADEGSDDTQ